MAAETLKVARWGMFFIPGIGRASDLRLASQYKMPFVRIGTNITEIDQAEPFIKQAKDLGMLVSYNGMKSYAVSPEKWGSCAAQIQQWGADIVCLVDSAGSMFPEDVSLYLKAARYRCSAALGFHGHDNLSLSMANTLRAIDEGAALVDASLQGMGRSAGNAITEVLVAILKKRHLLPDIELNALMDVGAALIRPLLGRRGVDPVAVTGGFASFHSSFTPKVMEYARKHGVDVRDLIVRLCQEDLIAAPDDLLESLAEELASIKRSNTLSISSLRTGGSRSLHGSQALVDLLNQLRHLAAKSGRFSVVNAVIAENALDEIAVSGNIQQTATHVIGSVAYLSNQHLETILGCVDGKVDLLLLDVDRKPLGPLDPAAVAVRSLQKTILLTYLDSRVWADAVEAQVVRLLGEQLEHLPIVIAGDHHKSRLVALMMAERGARVTLLTTGSFQSSPPSPGIRGITTITAGTAEAGNQIEEARMVVVWPGDRPWFGKTEASRISMGAHVLDASMGRFMIEAAEEVESRNGQLARLNMWPTLAGALLGAHESKRICMESMGRATVAGVPVVAGGAMGRKGDVIVDSIREPSRVIGIADGRGAIVFPFHARRNRPGAPRYRRDSYEDPGTASYSTPMKASIPNLEPSACAKLLLLGGNRSNVPSIRAARSAGFFTIVVDPHADSPSLCEADLSVVMDVRECDRLLTIIRDYGGVQGIISMSEAGVEPAAYLSAQLGLPSISQMAAANARSKAAMRQVWGTTEFSTEYAVAETEQEALQAINHLGFPLIFKPDRSFGGSRGVSRVESPADAVEAFHFAIRAGLPDTSVVIERCVTGSEHSCEVLIYRGKTSVLCIGQKVKSLPPYRVDVSVQYPALFSREQEELVTRMCNEGVVALGLTDGAAHVEFAFTPTGPVLFEIGARAGGGHTPQIAHSVSGVEEFIEICHMACGSSPTRFYPTQRRGADYRFLTFPPGEIRGFRIPGEVRGHPGIIDVDVLVKPGDRVNPICTASDRAGFVVTQGRDLADASDLANWACREITVTYADGSASCALPLCSYFEARQ